MKKFLASFYIIILFTSFSWCEGQEHQEFKNLMDAIKTKCPDAITTFDDKTGKLNSKYKTMNLTIHDRDMKGEILTKTHQQEGPNNTGFILSMSLIKGKYSGQAVVPQVMRGPYYSTMIDARATADGQSYYWIALSYGSRLDPELKNTILSSLPKGTAKNKGISKTSKKG